MFRKKLDEINDFTVMPGVPRAKMDQNESPAALPDEIMKKITASFFSMDINRYMRPETALKLREKIADYCGVDVGYIAAGAGADSMIHTLIEIFAGEGGSVFHFQPSYPIYGLFADICGCGKHVSSLDKSDFSMDRDEVEGMVSKSDVAFFTYPNNPTGNLFDRDFFLYLVDTYKECHFVADEAYYEFSGETFVKDAVTRENLTVIRTFSKYFSIPSLRLGYAVTSEKTAAMIRKCQFEPYNLSLFSAAAGIEILDNRELFRDSGELILAERERMYKELSSIPHINVKPSHGNFLFIREERPLGLAEGLHRRDVFVRDYGQMKGYEGYVRATVGMPEENDLFLDSVKKIVNTRSD